MYLPRSSKWSMNRRKRRPNYFGWIVFALVVAFGYYFNQIYLPARPNPFEATPTATKSAESFVTEAEELVKSGKLNTAIDSYEDAIASSPRDPNLYIALARNQMLVGQYAEAQDNASNALLLEPSNAMALAVRAWAKNAQGNNLEALDEIRAALKVDPNNGLIQAYYTEILVDSGSFENVEIAIETSKVALRLAPDSMEAHRARGILLEATTNYEPAVEEFKAALAINDNIPDLWLSLGLNYRQLSANEDAIDAFTRADILNPADPLPDLYISRTYAGNGDFVKALQYAETALGNNPTDAGLRGNYGVMLHRNFAYDKAVVQLRLAVYGGITEDGFTIEGIPLTNEIRVAEIYNFLALALARTGQCGEALQVVQEIQIKVPSNENAQANAAVAIRLCEELLANPLPSTSTPASVSATPAPSETPAVTTTP